MMRREGDMMTATPKIALRCTACHGVFSGRGEMVGAPATCPMCGDMSRFQRATAAPAAVAPAPKAETKPAKPETAAPAAAPAVKVDPAGDAVRVGGKTLIYTALFLILANSIFIPAILSAARRNNVMAIDDLAVLAMVDALAILLMVGVVVRKIGAIMARQGAKP